LILHAALYVAFSDYSIGGYIAFDGLTEEDVVPLRVNEVTVVDPTRENTNDVTTEVPDPPDTALDIVDLARALPPEEMRLSPEVSAPTNIDLSENPLADALEPMMISPETSLDEDLSKEIEAANIPLEAPEVAEDQPLISMTEEELLSDTSLQDFIEKLADPNGVGNSITDGYANLDDLLSYKGPVLEGKPILMPTDLLFGYNEATLQDSARLSLMKLGFIIQKTPDSVFVIEGHTDTFGAHQYNLLLSERRARAVRTWLSNSLGISGGRIRTRGYGETRPIVDITGTIEEQALNRRVEIAILSKNEAGPAEPEIRRAEIVE
jgi:outer membrane protein OmpA-like peptidoglycan-associated protein